MIPRYRLRLPDCSRRAARASVSDDTFERLEQIRAKNRRDIVRETKAAQKIFALGGAVGEITPGLVLGADRQNHRKYAARWRR